MVRKGWPGRGHGRDGGLGKLEGGQKEGRGRADLWVNQPKEEVGRTSPANIGQIQPQAPTQSALHGGPCI